MTTSLLLQHATLFYIVLSHNVLNNYWPVSNLCLLLKYWKNLSYPSGFDVKSFPRQSQYRGRGIATVCKSTLGSNITFKTNFAFIHTSFKVVQASITLQHNTLHFFCLYRPPPNRQNNLTDSMFTEQLPDLLDYVNNLPGFVCLVGDMNIHCNH